MADNSTEAILAAIGALDEKFDRKFDELKKVDKDLTEEVQRQGRRLDRLEGEFRDHKSDSMRARETDRAEASTTMQAIIKHVDESAKAFTAKAGKIDALEKMQVEQMATLSDIASAVKHPMVRKIVWGLGTLLLAWLASKGIR